MSSELSIREEVLAVDLNQPVEYIGAQLEQLWQKAEVAQDQQSLALIGDTWTQVQQLHQVAVTTQEIAAEFQQQRDEALEELETVREDHLDTVEELRDIHEALNDPWGTSNKKVSSMAEFIEESVAENYEYSYADMFADQAYDDMHLSIVENLTEHVGVTGQQADYFANVVMSEYYLQKLTPTQIAVLKSCIETLSETQP